MKLIVKKIAKMENAEVSVNGISVLAGYNSTGKSTVSKALNGIIRAYANIGARAKNSQVSSIVQILDNYLEEETATETEYFLNVGGIKRYASELVEKKAELPESCDAFAELLSRKFGIDMEESPEESPKLETVYEDVIQALNRPRADHIRFLVEREIRMAFDGQINTIGQGSLGKIMLVDEDDSPLCAVSFQNNRLSEYTSENVKLSVPVYLEPRHTLDDMLSRGYLRYGTLGVRQSSLFLPLLTRDPDPSEEGVKNETIESHEKTERVLSLIDETIQGGLAKSENSLVYIDKQFSQPVSIKNVASGSKTFAVIKRLVENGQLQNRHTLIIDEPEVNLHPAWQLTLARVLIILYKELGVNIFLNSHSPYFVRAMEAYSAQQGIAEDCHFYKTCPEANGLFSVKDVTNHPEEIYRELYLPFEEL